MDSILLTIKKLLGLDSNYDAFDVDILVGINSAFMSLCQIGVGPEAGFMVKGAEETWEEFLGPRAVFEPAIAYTYLKVRLLFDPPSSSTLIEAINNQISEYEWRLGIRREEQILSETAHVFKTLVDEDPSE